MGAGPPMRFTVSPHRMADIDARYGESALAGLLVGGGIG